MKVAVLGLWHLGPVTAACLAAAGHRVTGWDPEAATIEHLNNGRPPVAEPQLPELLARTMAAGTLEFTTDVRAAVHDADVVWIAFDTPVDEDDRADVEHVIELVTRALPHVPDGCLVLTSSQLPVGTVRRLEESFALGRTGRQVSFACSPENLRLGKAIDVFTRPDRVIAGVRNEKDQTVVQALLAPITDRIEWMSVESAEMSKHAINAFLATSVTFINEIAALCEQTGADAREVERALKTEKRIGPHAYLAPGAAFAGGTLARDIMFLRALGEHTRRPTPLMDGVAASNLEHRTWTRRRLEELLVTLHGKTVAIWGLTYKPRTDTLRRSPSVELCHWLLERGARVRVHDPAVRSLPPNLSGVFHAESPEAAAIGADVLVVSTEWPEYRQVSLDRVAADMNATVVLDANGFLRATIGADERFRVLSVGVPASQLK